VRAAEVGLQSELIEKGPSVVGFVRLLIGRRDRSPRSVVEYEDDTSAERAVSKYHNHKLGSLRLRADGVGWTGRCSFSPHLTRWFKKGVS